MKTKTRTIAVCAMMSAISGILMMLEFSVPFVPFFLKLDISELPALITAFAIGPWQGAAVCLVKNLINLPFTTTGGVGELANFLLGAVFVLTAGIIYKNHKNKHNAVTGSIFGSIVMGIISFPVNYFITYPVYTKLMPLDSIIELYQKIFGSVNSLAQCLLVFNVPFTIFKGLIVSLITILIYKKLSPIIKGRSDKK